MKKTYRIYRILYTFRSSNLQMGVIFYPFGCSDFDTLEEAEREMKNIIENDPYPGELTILTVYKP